jgi:glyoxylase-like metal-dependent hydrolase (beta-lactamase superfamily II)
MGLRGLEMTSAGTSGEIEITGLAQRQAWIDRDFPPVEQLRANLWSIPVPIPHNPLRYMSAYVFASSGGLTLLDTGWNSEEAWDALIAGLAGIGAAIGDVSGVLVTHMHFDHIGLAGRVREASGAWIALHQADRDILARPDFRDANTAAAREIQWLRSLGATEEEAMAAVGTPESLKKFVDVALPDRLLADGDLADVPGWSLRAIHTPGHTPGHLCFADEESKLFFSGDHVLPRITPNISADRFGSGDPLGDFLRSLQAIRPRQTSEVLPAHEWRFRGLAERVDQLTLHHENRLGALLAALREHPASLPWNLAGNLTWSRPWDQYSGRMQIFAVTETVAHLRHLEVRGLVTRTDDPAPTYTAMDPV